jgi:hypothetical protein
MQQTRGYVPPTPPPQAPPPQRMEDRPTWTGEGIPVARLGLFLVVAIVVGLLLYYVAGLPPGWAIMLSSGILLVAWVVDLMFATGYLHKREEQATERQRIRAALVDAAVINASQDEALAIIWEEIRRVNGRLDAMEVITVTERGGRARTVAKTDTGDLRIQQWLTSEIFDSAGRLVGVHPNGQIKRSFPFKENSGDEEAVAAWRRLAGAGLVGRNGVNYMWLGPQTLPAALAKLKAADVV